MPLPPSSNNCLIHALHSAPPSQTIGVTSSDDRAALKRELKVLKPYADKQKKLLDKQRKDEKKQAKKKKK